MPSLSLSLNHAGASVPAMTVETPKETTPQSGHIDLDQPRLAKDLGPITDSVTQSFDMGVI
jgi:hypothetical protein